MCFHDAAVLMPPSCHSTRPENVASVAFPQMCFLLFFHDLQVQAWNRGQVGACLLHGTVGCLSWAWKSANAGASSAVVNWLWLCLFSASKLYCGPLIDSKASTTLLVAAIILNAKHGLNRMWIVVTWVWNRQTCWNIDLIRTSYVGLPVLLYQSLCTRDLYPKVVDALNPTL